jgi:hypothetical protein
MKRIAVVTLWMALSGCASPPAAPDWVSGAALEYRPGEYLIGRGQGATGEEARDRARADLAKVFEAEVTAASADEQSFRDSRYEASSTRRIEVRTRRIVEGMEIARTWQEPASGSHHALAVLPRRKAASALREEIARLDETTRLQTRRAAETPDLFLKIGAAGQALAAQAERHGYQKTLRVVDPTGTGAPAAWNVARLQVDVEALLERVRLATRAEASVQPLLDGAVAAAGFLAAADADYVLEASLALEASGPVDDWYWQHGVLEIRLVDAASGRSRGSRRWPVKAAALAPGLAGQRALDQVDATLKKELRATLIHFASQESP